MEGKRESQRNGAYGIIQPIQGVWQGDALSITLFNLVSETTIQKLDTTGYIEVKTTQMCAYTNDIAIISKNERGLEENLIKLDSEVQKRGLKINQAKTMYM